MYSKPELRVPKIMMEIGKTPTTQEKPRNESEERRVNKPTSQARCAIIRTSQPNTTLVLRIARNGSSQRITAERPRDVRSRRRHEEELHAVRSCRGRVDGAVERVSVRRVLNELAADDLELARGGRGA